MPQPPPNQPHSHLSAAERQLRSRLVRLLSDGHGLIRGTLSVRERSCGKKNCRCATGEKHASLYLVVCLDGTYKQICVPRSLEAEVRSWVAQYQRVRGLMEEISKAYLEKLQKRGV